MHQGQSPKDDSLGDIFTDPHDDGSLTPPSRRTRAFSRSSGTISFADSVTILNADNSIDEMPMMYYSFSEIKGLPTNDDSFPSQQSHNSESAHSLALDDVWAAPSPNASQKNRSVSSLSSEKKVSATDEKKDDTNNKIIKAGLIAGFVMLIGPMFSRIKGLFRQDNADTLTQQTEKSPTFSNQPATQLPSGQHVTTAITPSRVGASSVNHMSAANESSRHFVAGYVYGAGDPVKQAVMRQAMLSAARSAGTSVAQGANVLAGTTAAVGVAVGTKLIVALVVMSVLLGGGFIALLATEEKNDLGGGGYNGVRGDMNSTNETEKGGGDAFPNSPYPVGEVLSTLLSDGSDNTNVDSPLCVSAVSVCEPWQQAVNGACSECDDGTISVVDGQGIATHVECEPCPPGTVRSNANGTGEGPCVSAEPFCEPWQYAVDGKCLECPAGEVSELSSENGLASYESCKPCPSGTVRSHVDGTGQGPCVPASNFCEQWQDATNGKCNDCPKGAVSSVDEFTRLPTHTGCDYCDPGFVRVSENGEPLGPCVPAAGICKLHPVAQQGKCVDCRDGSVPSVNTDGTPNFEECEFCPRGQVRSSANGDAAGPCVPAEGYCQTWEMAAFGRCTTCSRGQVSVVNDQGNPSHDDCTFCDRGRVRSSTDGRAEGPCVPAFGICSSLQRAVKGQCINCIEGELSTKDENGNFNHLSCAAR